VLATAQLKSKLDDISCVLLTYFVVFTYAALELVVLESVALESVASGS
jgi:hypothetical protein